MLLQDPAKPLSNTQRAVEVLRELIFRGELAAGSNHLESELAERLGMSRTPVREATLMLEAQGLVEVKPRKGVRIASLSPDDMREVYEVLTELESLAAERAAEAGYSEADLAELVAAIEAMEAALEAEDRESWASADDRFHRELVRLGGNTRVQSIVSMMGDQVRRARSVTLYMRPMPLKSNEDHRRVLEAISSGDSATARSVHRTHRQHAREVLIDLLKRHHLHHV